MSKSTLQNVYFTPRPVVFQKLPLCIGVMIIANHEVVNFKYHRNDSTTGSNPVQ
jgi:hypothetical protein